MTPEPILPVCSCGNPLCVIPRGLCHCGCGETTGLYRQSHPDQGQIEGQPILYLRGHFRRLQAKLHYKKADPSVCICGDLDCKIPYGRCHCGCGEKTNVATCTVTAKGTIKGEPKRYVGRHASKGRQTNLSHGQSGTSEYGSWSGMRARCLCPTNKAYPYYGGRGITICQRWLDSFQNFLDDMGLKPSPLHSIDRINNDGNYEPENCRWATDLEQAQNRREHHNNSQSRKTHCPKGHPYTEENTIRKATQKGWRSCRTCVNEKKREAARLSRLSMRVQNEVQA